MSAVYKALNIHLDTFVAIKEISDNTIKNPQDKEKARKRFKKEAKLLASFQHHNIPTVMDFFSDETKLYIVMEFVDGITLKDFLKSNDSFLKENLLIDWAIQLCNVLSYLHNRPSPVIYRDLKADNIMISQEGTLKLIDFGIARLFNPQKRKDTEQLGTPGFCPPEQCFSGKQTDIRSDIYALGATLHYLATGLEPAKHAFNFPTVGSINNNISEEFDKIIMKALELTPKNRWQNIQEIESICKLLKNNDKRSENIPLQLPLQVIPRPIESKITPNINEKRLICLPDEENSSWGELKNLEVNKQELQETDEKDIKSEEIILKSDDLNVANLSSQNIKDVETTTNLPLNVVEQKKRAILPHSPIFVCSSRTGDYTTITEAIQYAAPGAEIIIKSGDYIEEIYINKPVNIRAADSNVSIMSHNNSITIENAKVHINNLTIKSPAKSIFINGGELRLEYCKLKNPIHLIRAKIEIIGCSISNSNEEALLICDCIGTIKNCDVFDIEGAGIYIKDSKIDILTSNIFNCNSYGILVSQNSIITLENCQIYGNEEDGIFAKDKSRVNIKNCKIKENKGTGITFLDNTSGFVENCEIFPNQKGNIVNNLVKVKKSNIIETPERIGPIEKSHGDLIAGVKEIFKRTPPILYHNQKRLDNKFNRIIVPLITFLSGLGMLFYLHYSDMSNSDSETAGLFIFLAGLLISLSLFFFVCLIAKNRRSIGIILLIIAITLILFLIVSPINLPFLISGSFVIIIVMFILIGLVHLG